MKQPKASRLYKPQRNQKFWRQFHRLRLMPPLRAIKLFNKKYMNTAARLTKTKLSSKISFNVFLILAILLLLVAGGAAWFARRGDGPWRAVFLTNNQVYFGHFLWKPFSSTIALEDIYYLQVSQSLQQGDAASLPPEMKIIKFGNEIHGPTDKMIILKSQILFWEDLREDSELAQKIKSSKD